ncbi:MAG: DNA recombination protein RmuC [Bacteroidota bacterium]|nr:DNA recombination protein RmuC [Bacteroidota bacterium]
MEVLPIFIGIVIGAIISYVIFNMLSKGKNIPRTEYDNLTTRFHESSSNLRLAEDRLKTHQDAALSNTERMQSKELEMSGLLSRTASLETSLKNYDERIKEFSVSLQEERRTNQLQQTEINKHLQALAQITANNKALQDKLESQKDEILQMQRTSHLQFEKLAQQIFEEKSGKFTETNKANIEAILKPLSENIETFKRKVEETYDKESKERFSLGEKVKDLIENTSKVSQEANNLATALKGQTKKQGDWGETILERILEMSGLEKGREYFVQENLKDEEGRNVRPDVIVRLPDNRNIILDSKVSMNAYLRYSESESKEEQDIFSAQHLNSIYTHIDQLSQKKYHELVESLDYVGMFIPIEPAYILAVQSDPNLWSAAYTKKIVLISPTTLIVTLKVVADLWKVEQQNKNAKQIAIQGTKLYEKFVGFLDSIEDVGKQINRSQESYLKAVGQLRDGRDNLIRQAEKLKDLGIKSPKKIPGSLKPIDLDDDEIELLPGATTSDEL